MKISLDISMYPLKDEFCQPIIDFIERLEQAPGLVLERNSLSTQVFGDYRTIMNLMTEELETVFEQNPHTIFVMKMVGVNRSKAKIDAC
ncbi:MAG: hypothetical protein IBX48_05645 [Thiomicrospira sp.]|uniref:hypothetical protein n=1 Tax=Thiomicrospira sp. TaxID=935 RepID=UPI0019E4217F|nr:hypothetical protein [Thiomicrospira sp.]MBE0493807.1 hypothetical protein [Thiomicrospira sp.]